MNAYKKYMAEFLGNYILVFIGFGFVCANYILTQAGQLWLGVLGIVLSCGFAVVAIVYALDYVSGSQIIPTYTVSLFVTKRIDANTAIMYIIAQLAGAAFAGFLLRVLFLEDLEINLDTFSIAPGVRIVRVILTEVILSFLLIFAIRAWEIGKRAVMDIAIIAIGLVVVFEVIVGTPVVVVAVIPSIVFGVAIAFSDFGGHYVYWIGSISGGVIAIFLLDLFFRVVSLEEEAQLNGLTKLYNKKTFDSRIVEKINKSKIRSTTFTLALIDIDYFKRINDNFGHPTGDEVLRKLSAFLKNYLSEGNFVARYGGEEFAIILDEGNRVHVQKLLEDMRESISKQKLNAGNEMISFTVSIGIAFYKSQDTAESLIKRADEALYCAKKGGRNMVVVEDVC